MIDSHPKIFLWSSDLRIRRQHSSESMSSINSTASHSSMGSLGKDAEDKKKKKKSWVSLGSADAEIKCHAEVQNLTKAKIYDSQHDSLVFRRDVVL